MPRTEILEALRAARKVAPAVLLISLGVNLLLLASPLYMLQVFDRVLSGRSLETLLYLSIAVALALAVMGALDACRALIFVRLGDWLEAKLSRPVWDAALAVGAQPSARATTRPFEDMAAVRQFLASPGPGALCDAPLMPAFLAIIWLMHPLLGAVAVGSAIALAAIAVSSEVLARTAARRATSVSAEAQALRDTALANADAVQGMGLGARLGQRWAAVSLEGAGHQLAAVSIVSVLSVAAKALRLGVQACILGAGAYLVLERSLSPGQMIAASILLGRALAPVEVALSAWRQFVQARQAWRRLVGLLRHHAQRPEGLALPTPQGLLEVRKATLPGTAGGPPLLNAISFELPAGEVLGILGPSGSGKSSLARLLVRAWRPAAGSVRLDGADLEQWEPEALGAHVGYLPQVVDLFSGSVRDNVARFGEASLDQVVTAALLARAHDMILGLPGGYDGWVGVRGERLSGGQRQRVGLARAVFGGPRLVVLDEPDANLDSPGAEGLVHCIADLKAQGVTVVVVAHRRKLLSQCDRLLVLESGQLALYGPAPQVVARLKEGGAEHLRALQGGKRG